MWYFAIIDRAAGSIEAQIRDVVLAAGVEAAADFDVEVLDRIIEYEELLAQAISNLCRQTARRSDAQLASIRARAGCDIDNRARARLGQPNALQFTVQIRQISLADPSQHNILFHCRTDIVAAETARNVGELPALPCGHISQWERDRYDGISRLSLLIHIRSIPCFETVRRFVAVQASRLSLRRFLVAIDVCQIAHPTTVFGHDLPLFQHDSPELINANLGYEEFDSSGRPVLLFAQSGEHA